MAAKVGTDDELVMNLKSRKDLQRVTKTLADAKIGIDGLSYAVEGDERIVHLLPSDPGKAKTALKREKFDVSENRVVTVPISNKAGDMQRIVSKLEKEGIEIETIYPTISSKGPFLALEVPDVDKVRKVLGT